MLVEVEVPEVEVVDELLVEELLLEVDPGGFVVVVELEADGESSDGAAVGGFGEPTSAVLDTLGWAAPAGPAAKARRMFSVTRRIRQRIVEFVVIASPQLMSSSRGDHPNVPAENTPAPLGVEYQVESA